MTAPILAGHCEILLDNGLYADLMTEIPGLSQSSFQSYCTAASKDRVSDTMIPFFGYADLLRNKVATNRSKDRLDVDELRRIHGESASDTGTGA